MKTRERRSFGEDSCWVAVISVKANVWADGAVRSIQRDGATATLKSYGSAWDSALRSASSDA